MRLLTLLLALPAAAQRCATWIVANKTVVECAARVGDTRPRGVVVPTYPKHYAFFARLLRSVRQFAADAVPVVGVLSGDLAAEAPKLRRHTRSLIIEATDLRRLIALDDASRGLAPSAARSAVLEAKVLRSKRRELPTAGFFVQALKKLLAVRFAGLEMALGCVAPCVKSLRLTAIPRRALRNSRQLSSRPILSNNGQDMSDT